MSEITYVDTPIYDDPIFYYYHSDHLGSSNIMTDREGDLVQHYPDTSGFGDLIQSCSSNEGQATSNCFMSTGLYYYGARYGACPELVEEIRGEILCVPKDCLPRSL